MKRLLLVVLILGARLMAQTSCASTPTTSSSSTGWTNLYCGLDSPTFPAGFMSGSGWATMQFVKDTGMFYQFAGNLGGINPENNAIWGLQPVCAGNPTPTWCSTFPQKYTGTASTTGAAIPTTTDFWIRVSTNGGNFGETNTNRNNWHLAESMTSSTGTCGGVATANCFHVAVNSGGQQSFGQTSLPSLFIPAGDFHANDTNINGVIWVGNEAIGYDTCTVEPAVPNPTIYTGTVNTDSTGTVVTLVSGPSFSSSWAGDIIKIASSFIRVTSVQSGTQLTLAAATTANLAGASYAFDNDCHGGSGNGNGPSGTSPSNGPDAYLWGWNGTALRGLRRGIRQTAGWGAAVAHTGGAGGGNTSNAEPAYIGAANPTFAANTTPVSGNNGSSPPADAWSPNGDPNSAEYMNGTSPHATLDSLSRCIGGSNGGTMCTSSAQCTGGGSCQAFISDSKWDHPGDRHSIGSLVYDPIRGRLWVINGWEENYYWPDTWSLCISTPRSPYSAAGGAAATAFDKCASGDVYTNASTTSGFQRMPLDTNGTRFNGLANSNAQPNSGCGANCAAFSLYGGWGNYDTSLEQNASAFDPGTDSLWVFSGLPSGSSDDMWVLCLSTPGHISDSAVTQVAFACTSDTVWRTWVHVTKFGSTSNACTTGSALNTTNATANYCGTPAPRGSARMIVDPSFSPTGHEVLLAFGGMNKHDASCSGENIPNAFCLSSNVGVFDPVGGTACNGTSCTAYNGGNWCNSYLTGNQSPTPTNTAPNGGNGEWNSSASWCSSWTAGVFGFDTTTFASGCLSSPCSFQLQPANMPARVFALRPPSQGGAAGSQSTNCINASGPCLNQEWGFPNVAWDSTRNFATVYMGPFSAAWGSQGFFTYAPNTNTWTHLSVGSSGATGPTYDATFPMKTSLGYDSLRDVYILEGGGSSVSASQGIFPQLWEIPGSVIGAAPQTFRLTVQIAGTGSGHTSDGAGFTCPVGTCSNTYTSGTNVTLSASPNANSVFAGWSGDCSGVNLCSLNMTAAHSVTATFNLPARTTQDTTFRTNGTYKQ